MIKSRRLRGGTTPPSTESHCPFHRPSHCPSSPPLSLPSHCPSHRPSLSPFSPPFSLPAGTTRNVRKAGATPRSNSSCRSSSDRLREFTAYSCSGEGAAVRPSGCSSWRGRDGTAFPCASAAVLPTTDAFACGALVNAMMRFRCDAAKDVHLCLRRCSTAGRKNGRGAARIGRKRRRT